MKHAFVVDGRVYQVIESAFFDADVFGPASEEGGQPPVIAAKGDEIPLGQRFTAEFLASVFAIPEGQGVSVGDTFDGSAFGPPPASPAPTAAQVLTIRDALLTTATTRIAPLQDAVDLDDATADETALLKAWKQYRVALSRVEQQASFPAAVVWPVAPA